MALNNKGLGRGIQALFESGHAASSGGQPDSPLRIVDINTVCANPDQPRKTFSEASLRELAASIEIHGILQPLLVRPASNDTWQLIAGERRLRAARIAGLTQVPILVRPLSDQDTLIVALLENLQREDLNPIEEAQGLEALKRAANASIEELADMLGQARSTISNTLRLLALDPEIQAEVAKRQLSPSHAKILAGLPASASLELYRQIREKGMTIRQTEEAVGFWRENNRFPWQEDSGNPEPASHQKLPDPDLLHIEASISSTLNCRVKLSGNQNRGKISLAYASNAELHALLAKLGLPQ